MIKIALIRSLKDFVASLLRPPVPLQVLEAAAAGEWQACGRRGFAGVAGVRAHMAHRANRACRSHATYTMVRGGS